MNKCSKTQCSVSKAAAFAFFAASLLVAGCQQKMARQPSFRPDGPCVFFPDGTSSRQPAPGTVARGHLRTDVALYTGATNLPELPVGSNSAAANEAANDNDNTKTLLAAEAAQFSGALDEFPMRITREALKHGRNRYLIYCVVCHDAAGTGMGKIVERGYTRPPSYHIERLRRAPVGYLFRVVSQGYGSMPSYAAQIPTRDRWAIVAYIRALQLSQHFPVDKLPEDMRGEWDNSEQVATAGGGQP